MQLDDTTLYEYVQPMRALYCRSSHAPRCWIESVRSIIAVEERPCFIRFNSISYVSHVPVSFCSSRPREYDDITVLCMVGIDTTAATGMDGQKLFSKK